MTRPAGLGQSAMLAAAQTAGPSPDLDTPSRWLTFGGTPNGGALTPGTAFGSPFWASLSRQAGLGDGHHSLSPKAYSPSREYNPFEVSFFPTAADGDGASGQEQHSQHSQHTAADLNNASSTRSNSGNAVLFDSTTSVAAGSDTSITDTAHMHAGAVNRRENGNPLSASLKRPFEDAYAAANDSRGSSRSASGSFDVHEGAAVDAAGGMPGNLLAVPAWKRPKYHQDFGNDSSASNSFASGTGGSSSDSPSSIGLGYTNHSPADSAASPASSVLPTPGLQNATVSASSNQQNGTAVNGLPTKPFSSQEPTAFAHISSSAPQHQLPLSQMQLGAHGAPPVPLYGFSPFHAQPFHAHHPMAAQGPIVLPPVSQAQIHAQQAAAAAAAALNASTASASSQSPTDTTAPSSSAAGATQLNAIPYANGRAPSAQPIQTRRQSKKRTAGLSVKAEEADEEEERAQPEVKQPHNTRRQPPLALVTQHTNTYQPANTPKSAKPTAKSAASANAVNLNAAHQRRGSAAIIAIPEPNSAAVDDQKAFDESLEGLDEEGKRRAFLERNRQAACRSRQKKKEWIGNLETHAAHLQAQNSALTAEIEVLQKELFALRHTLQFHERSGCAAVRADIAHAHPVNLAQSYPPRHAPQLSQSLIKDSVAGLAHMPPVQHQQVQPQPLQARLPHVPVQALPNSMVQRAPYQTSSHPLASAPQADRGGPAASGAVISATNRAHPEATLAPPLLGDDLKSSSQPLGKLQMDPFASNPFFTSHGTATLTSGQTHRPGSAGATFGLNTPNFADLFDGMMQTIKTPGGILRQSPTLPNTFGLSLQDIPVRPASAPPTPSPMLPFAAAAPAADYFSAKRPGTLGFPFGDQTYSLPTHTSIPAVLA